MIRTHQCWRRMLERKCFGDNFEMLVTDSSNCNITKKSQFYAFVTNILMLSPSQIHQHDVVTNITKAKSSYPCHIQLDFVTNINKMSLVCVNNAFLSTTPFLSKNFATSHFEKRLNGV